MKTVIIKSSESHMENNERACNCQINNVTNNVTTNTMKGNEGYPQNITWGDRKVCTKMLSFL